MTTRLRLRAGLTIRALPDGDAVVAKAEGADAVIINTSAHAILEMLSEPGTEQDVVDELCRAFPQQSAAAIQKDVHELIARLVSDGILEECGSARSTA